MARNHARILTSIWGDADFLALEPEAQRVYLMLVSQPDLTPCGALPYVPARWARLSALTGTDEIENAITLLEDAGYVVVDRDTAELIIRTFVVHDGGLGNPKMRGAVKGALKALHSEQLRSIVVGVIPPEYRDQFDNPIANRSTIGLPIASRSAPVPKNAEVGGRGRGTSSSSSKGSSQRSRESFDEDFDAWWTDYPRKVDKAEAKAKYTARRREGVPAETLRCSLRNYRKAVAGVEQTFIKHGATFLAKDGPWLEYQNGIPAGAAPGKPGIPEPARAALGRGLDAAPVWELDEHGNAVSA